jgi:phosphatidylglycerophosphate synthase
VTALHGGFAALRVERGRAGLAWISGSWILAVTHLGLLEDRRELGAADLLTLTRANLPAVAPRAKATVAVTAVATDVLDGPLARWSGTTTPFGRDADSLADAAFWIWFAGRYEPSRLIRCLLWSVEAMPVLAVAGLSIARGRMVQPPRPRWLRPAATLQALLLTRSLHQRKPVKMP